MGERYLSAVAMGGRLYVQNLSDQDPSWESRRLAWLPEQHVDLIFQPLAGERKVKTVEELGEAVRASERGLPTIKIWIDDCLEDEVRRIWEESRSGPRTSIGR